MTGNSKEVTITIRAKDDGTLEVLSGKFRSFGAGLESSASSSMKRLDQLRQSVFSLHGAIVALGGGIGVGLLTKSFLDAASTSEQLRLRLGVLLGSVSEGNRLFKEMSTFAAKVPYEYEEIMQAATALSGVLKGGVDEVKRWMPLISDLAAASGLSIEDTTSQIIRMYSAGAASADLFRERGILAMLGFQSGVQYSAKETQKILFDAWTAVDSKFRGTATGLGKTWDGMVSNLEDRWFAFRNRVMERGVFEALEEKLQHLLDFLEQADLDGRMDKWAQSAAKFATVSVRGLGEVMTATGKTIQFIEEHKELAEYGLIGWIIRGRKGLLAGVGLGMVEDAFRYVKDQFHGVNLALEAALKETEAQYGKEAADKIRQQITQSLGQGEENASNVATAVQKIGEAFIAVGNELRTFELKVDASGKKVVDSATKTGSGVTETTEAYTKEQLTLIERLQNETIGAGEQTLEKELELLNRKRAAYEKELGKNADLDAWYQAKRLELIEKYAEKERREYEKQAEEYQEILLERLELEKQTYDESLELQKSARDQEEELLKQKITDLDSHYQWASEEAQGYHERLKELAQAEYEYEVQLLKQKLAEQVQYAIAIGATADQIEQIYRNHDQAVLQKHQEVFGDLDSWERNRSEQLYESLSGDLADFLDTITGSGEDLEDWIDDWTKRVKGYFVRMIAEMMAAWVLGLQNMQSASTGTNLLSGLFGGGGFSLSGLGGSSGGFNLFGGGGVSNIYSLFGGGTGGYDYAAELARLGTGSNTYAAGAGYGPQWSGWNSAGAGLLAFLTQGLSTGNWGRAAISGVGTGLGSYGGAALGSALGMSGNLIFPIVGGIVGGLLGNLLGGLFGKDHTYRRQRRGTQWEQALSEFSTAEDWESMIDTATYGTGAIYLGGREWQASHPGQFRPFTVGNERPGAYSDWDAGVKIQHAGYEWTELKDAMTYEDYDRTISWWDDIAAAALNSLDDQKEATVATARELANYKDKIELTKELMGGWKEAGQEAAQEMLQMYENMKRMTIEDLTEKFAAGTITIEEFTEALQELDLTPMERATTLASAALQGLLDTAELGSAQMVSLYDIYQQNVVAAGQLTEATNDLAQVQALITSGADLTEEELTTLIAYYRLLKQVLDGTIESMTDFAAAQAAASAILDRDAIAALQQYQMALRGASDNEIQQAVWAKRYQFGDPRTGVLGLGSPENMVAWFKTASYDELKAYAQMFGVSVETLIADIMAMDASIKDSAAAAAAHAAALADTADRLAQSRAKILGASETDLSWLAISQRWGWDETGGRTEQQIREGIEWYLHGASAEDIYNLATSKGMSVEQFIADIEWMAEQMGYFTSATEDATDAIRDLESAAESWKGLSQEITNQIRGITFSEANPLTAVQRMGLVYQTIQGLTGGRSIEAYLGGISDVAERQEAVQELSDLWGEYLQLAQEAYQRPSNQYQREYDLTLANLEALKDYSLSEYDVALQQLQALQQIVANTSPEVETPAGGDGAAAGGDVDKYGRITYGTIGGQRYAVSVMGGPGIDSRYAPDLPLPEHYHWEYNYSASIGVPYWYALADAPEYALPQFDRGIDYVPYDMPAYIHHREAVLNPVQADAWRSGYGQQQISLSLAANITINGANKTNNELKDELRSEMRAFLRDEGGKMVEEIIKYSGAARRG